MCRRTEIRNKIYASVEIIDLGYTTPCHIWQGATSGEGRGGGYGRMSLSGQTVAVHRVTYINENGFVPSRKQIDHLCRNRLCVNVDHLEMVTNRENQKRKRNG